MEARLRAWVDGRYVDLADVVRMVGDNPWTWRLEELEAVSRPDGATRAGDVEQRLRAEGPLPLTWREVVSLAAGLHQTIWCRLVAVVPGTPEPALTIDCVDSSTWELAAADGDEDGAEALRRVVRQWPTAG